LSKKARKEDRPPHSRAPGRVASALAVLFGRRLTPLQIEAEWVEYKGVFQDLLGRHGALLARMAKAEKERLDRSYAALEDVGPPGSSAEIVTKQDARSRLATRKFGLVVGGGPQPVPPESEE